MTYKTEYSTEEWTAFMHAPYYAGTYIQYADVHHRDQKKELHAMVAEVTLWEIPDGAKELMRPLYADIGKFREDNENLPGYDEDADPLVHRDQALPHLRDVMAILVAKATAEEQAAFQGWLMDIAQKTAEAGKESALSIFGKRVSEKEQAALDELKEALGISE